MRIKKIILSILFVSFCTGFMLLSSTSANAANNKRYSLSELNKMIKENPNDFNLRDKRAEYYYGKADYNRALIDINRMIKLQPENARPYFSRGLCYYYLKKYSLAFESADKSIKINGNYFGGYLLKGMYYHYYKKNIKQAIVHYEQAYSHEKKFMFLVCNLASAYKENDEIDKAIKTYKSCIKLDKNYIAPYNDICWIYATNSNIRKSDFKKAITYANKILKFDNLEWYNYGTVAAAYARNGKFEEAVKYQNVAIKGVKKGSKEYKDCLKRLELYQNNKPYIEN